LWRLVSIRIRNACRRLHEPDLPGTRGSPRTITFRHNWRGRRRRGISLRKITRMAPAWGQRNRNQMGELATQDAAIAPQETALLAVLGRRSVVLVGMMGAGKFSIGRRLAQRLGVGFVDADAEIEAAA